MNDEKLTHAEAMVLDVLLEDEGRRPWLFSDLSERVGEAGTGMVLAAMERKGLVQWDRMPGFLSGRVFGYRATEAGERAHAAHFGRKAAAEQESWVWYSVACVAVLIVVVVAIWLGGA